MSHVICVYSLMTQIQNGNKNEICRPETEEKQTRREEHKFKQKLSSERKYHWWIGSRGARSQRGFSESLMGCTRSDSAGDQRRMPGGRRAKVTGSIAADEESLPVMDDCERQEPTRRSAEPGRRRSKRPEATTNVAVVPRCCCCSSNLLVILDVVRWVSTPHCNTAIVGLLSACDVTVPWQTDRDLKRVADKLLSAAPSSWLIADRK